MAHSVLERIRKKAASLKETSLVSFRTPEEIKRDFRKSPKKNEKHPRPRGIGRPRIDEGLKTKDIRISLKAHLFRLLETRKKKAKSRSEALCDLLDKGLKYEQLRHWQAERLKAYLKDFAKALSAVKVTKSPLWRMNRIDYDKNEEALARLYKKSLAIKNFVELAHINPTTFDEVGEFLTKRERRYLEFSAVPERIAGIVEAEKNG